MFTRLRSRWETSVVEIHPRKLFTKRTVVVTSNERFPDNWATTSSILSLVIPTSSIAASSRNRGNYQHIGKQVPTKWKRNCITGALHRAKRISTDFDKDIKTLETSFINAGYPKRFISHTINNFLNDSSQDDNLIPNFLFEERKKVFFKLPFCGKNEKLNKTFIEKRNKFTNFNFIFIILWQTR